MNDKKWDADSYSKNSQLQYQASKAFFSTLLLNADETILDIGCGTGLLTKEIAEKIPQGKIIGIDSSESMIAHAKENFSRNNVEYILMKAEELHFPFKFDTIISSFCIQWVKDKQSLFNKIAKHLKKDGKIRLIMPFRHVGMAKIRSDLMKQKKWSSYFNPLEVEQLLIFDNDYDKYAKNAGLKNISFETENVTTIFEDTSKLKIFLKNITASLENIPNEQLKEEFMQEVVNSYIRINPVLPNGNCQITYTYAKIRTFK